MNFYIRNLKKQETIFHTLYSQSIHKYSQIIQVPSFLPHHHDELIFYICLNRSNFPSPIPSHDPCWVQSKGIFLSTLLFFLYFSLRNSLTYKVLIMKIRQGLAECKYSNNSWQFIKVNYGKHCSWLPNIYSIRFPLISSRMIWNLISIKGGSDCQEIRLSLVQKWENHPSQ